MASVQNDIVEIRRTVYGRNMRAPLVDALGHLKDINVGVVVRRLGSVTAELNDKIIDGSHLVPRIVYNNYDMESLDDDDLTVTLLNGEDYDLQDDNQEDGISYIRESDYRLDLSSSKWDSSEMKSEKKTVYDKVLDKDTYTLVLNF